MCSTIYRSFLSSVKQYPQKIALMYKTGEGYAGITYEQLNDMVDRVAASLIKLDVKKGDRIAMFSYNRPEWTTVDLACQKLGVIVVPIYHTLPPPAAKYIINDSGSKLIFVENAELFKKIDSVRKEIPSVSAIIAFDTKGIDEQKNLLKFSDLGDKRVKTDKSIFDNLIPISESDIATIVYTSGTTGDPKGVVLSHKNIVSNACAAIKRFHIAADDVFLSYLPLCHMFERTCGHYTVLFTGGTIGYAEDVTTIAEDILRIRPTILLVVPRVIEKAYNTVVQEIEKSSPIKKVLVLSAVKNLNKFANLMYKNMPVPLWLRIKCFFYNNFIASKFKKLAGGRLRALVSGAAPLNRQISKIFYILGFNIVEGYGLTEASPVISSNSIEDNKLGTVGKPLEGIEIRIGESEEILVKGPNIMQRYFNKPEITARTIDKNGWLHTGDKGKIDEEGNLIISGRIKEIIITSYGKNIAPVPIETAIVSSNYIDQVMIFGDNRKYITALIAPAKGHIKNYAAEKNITFKNYADLLQHQEIKNLIADEIDKATVDFARYEKVKAFILIPENFTVENGMMTPTLKLRRGKIIESFGSQIDSMYN